MDVNHSKVEIDSYFHPLLVLFMLGSALAAIRVGVTGLLLPTHEALESHKGKQILFLSLFRRLLVN